jgi:hypothetical protein
MIRQCRDTPQTLAFRFRNSAGFDLIDCSGYRSAALFIHSLHIATVGSNTFDVYVGNTYIRNRL